MKKFEKLDQFFSQIKNLGFWQRVFRWRALRNLSYEAFEEYKKLIDSLDATNEQLSAASMKLELLSNDQAHTKEECAKLQNTLNITSFKKESLEEECANLNKENAIFKKTEDARLQDYNEKLATLTAVSERVQNEREVEKQRLQEKEIQRLTEMKETWAKHETNVKEVIKRICQKHTIQYVDQVPFKGKPDNTVQICDEYIIFDAKSPSSDDLTNFPAYIKAQTESVKKYIKESDVRKDIFLVIPSNTVDVIESFCFDMADYKVYVVTVDVLEPLILSLQKIEDYEFAEQLTPEDRENICRIIGKFAHLTKRKMQVDLFFTKEFIDFLKKCETNLPEDILEKVRDYEKAEKINPPRESRTKQILTKDLEVESDLMQSGIEKLPLIESRPTLPAESKA